VARNAEVIRQWTILREIEAARGAGATIDELAALCSVTTRTIRRDLQALEEAGFPLFDDKSGDDGRTRWNLNGQALKGLSTGLTLSELCALYFSRTLVEALAGTPFRADVARAFEKLSLGLTPHMRQFLDELPQVISTKPDPMHRRARSGDAHQRQIVARALDATLRSRQATIVYDSRSSQRTKTYLVHPYRLAYAQGGMYLLAYVPEYGEIRTFALESIRQISLLEERFTPIDTVPADAFPHSLGVHSGPPVRVTIDFLPSAARFVQSREWHSSQRVTEFSGGGVRMTLDVCLDRALESWILSFGPSARVVSPESLVTEIARQLDEARAAYKEQPRNHETTKSH
jgi:predicted DNA-binding transcriptional regulator YafY